MMPALIWCGVRSGLAACIRAAIPATCGADIEVPVREWAIGPALEAAEEMRVPGADTSGLTMPSDPCAAREERGMRVSATDSSWAKADPAYSGPSLTCSVPA